MAITLSPTLERGTILTDKRPELAVVNRGYRGHAETEMRVLLSGARRGLTTKLIADLRRPRAVEAERAT